MRDTNLANLEAHGRTHAQIVKAMQDPRKRLPRDEQSGLGRHTEKRVDAANRSKYYGPLSIQLAVSILHLLRHYYVFDEFRQLP